MKLYIPVLLLVSLSISVTSYGKNSKYDKNSTGYKGLKILQSWFQDDCDTISLDNLEKLIEECKKNYKTEVPTKCAKDCIPLDGGEERTHYDCSDLINIFEKIVTNSHPHFRYGRKVKFEDMPEEALEHLAPYKIKQLENEIVEAQKKIDFLSKKRR